MKIALTGANGFVGNFLRQGLPGHITTLGRRATDDHHWDLTGPAPDLRGFDALVHSAFAHVPGRYRGGEGSDPDGFLRANLDGTKRLFDAAARDGVTRIVFLSSRAVFDGLPEATRLTEDCAPNAASLYGQAKIAAEDHLFALPLCAMSLRATGIYGPMPNGQDHKWSDLFCTYLAGQTIAPRRGTELHGDDLASACTLLLQSGETGPYHASDILLDRHDLLGAVQQHTGCPHAPPAPSDRQVTPLICDRLRALGWRPGGTDRLLTSLPMMLDQARTSLGSEATIASSIA